MPVGESFMHARPLGHYFFFAQIVFSFLSFAIVSPLPPLTPLLLSTSLSTPDISLFRLLRLNARPIRHRSCNFHILLNTAAK